MKFVLLMSIFVFSAFDDEQSMSSDLDEAMETENYKWEPGQCSQLNPASEQFRYRFFLSPFGANSKAPRSLQADTTIHHESYLKLF